MAATMLLDRNTWDLVLDVDGNVALASEPYSLAQDAASEIKTFLGEVYFDTLVGVPYLTQIFGKKPPLPLLKATLERAAMRVPGVSSAKCFITKIDERAVSGQVQVTSAATGQTQAASFDVVSPQGGG